MNLKQRPDKCREYGCLKPLNPETPRYCRDHANAQFAKLYKFYTERLNLTPEKAREVSINAVKA